MFRTRGREDAVRWCLVGYGWPTAPADLVRLDGEEDADYGERSGGRRTAGYSSVDQDGRNLTAGTAIHMRNEGRASRRRVVEAGGRLEWAWIQRPWDEPGARDSGHAGSGRDPVAGAVEEEPGELTARIRKS